MLFYFYVLFFTWKNQLGNLTSELKHSEASKNEKRKNTQKKTFPGIAGTKDRQT